MTSPIIKYIDEFLFPGIAYSVGTCTMFASHHGVVIWESTRSLEEEDTDNSIDSFIQEDFVENLRSWGYDGYSNLWTAEEIGLVSGMLLRNLLVIRR